MEGRHVSGSAAGPPDLPCAGSSRFVSRFAFGGRERHLGLVVDLREEGEKHAEEGVAGAGCVDDPRGDATRVGRGLTSQDCAGPPEFRTT